MDAATTATPSLEVIRERPWVTALGLALGPAVALGLARFAYALLLPAMRTDLSWSFAQAGAMNTANAVGYLLGALIAAPVAARLGARRALIAGMLLTSLALVACAGFASFPALITLRLLAGAAGAVTFIVGASLVARLAAGSYGRAALMLGVYFAGGGLGIAVSGLLVPVVLSQTGAAGWRWGWVLLGLLAFLASAAVLPATRRAPPPARPARGEGAAWRPGPFAMTIGAYALFGAGYIAYVTFIVAFLKGEGAGSVEVSAFWAVLGVAAMASAFVWGPILGRLRGGLGIALATAIVAAGALLPLLSGSGLVAFASAVLFGGAFLSVPTAVTAFARRALDPQYWTAAIAALTVAFAAGQCVGPVLAGVLSDGPSGVRAGLLLSVAVLVASAVLASAQRHRQAIPTANP